MKKTNILMLPLLFSCALCAVGEEKKNNKQKIYRQTIITPVLEQKMEPGKNIIWCVTYQLAWNELCKLTGGPFKTSQTIPMVESLNKHTSTEITLNENCYVAVAGADYQSTYEKIMSEMQKKFKGRVKTTLLPPNSANGGGGWLTYAYMEKYLPFKWEFNRYRNKLKFGNKEVDFWGQMHQDGALMAGDQVIILDYVNNDNFIIELKTESNNNRLILAKITPKETLKDTIISISNRLEKSKPDELKHEENLSVPVIDFDFIQSYSDLNKIGIGISLQRIRFTLDEKGAVLISESMAAACRTDKEFIFDKPFLVLLFQRASDNGNNKSSKSKTTELPLPYFALWIANTELLVSTYK